MSPQPAYYEVVRQRAKRQWDQLEQDPELAGPWHLLFKQVQSPRHVLSELLQNADDANATEASVCIENQTFIFEHNGEDFLSEHFASLCRFGYSNKRTLHTIGFRGIGFKSTFSLGSCVKLFTPSLSVCFRRKRFTEPHWISEGIDTLGKTRVIVKMGDKHRYREVEKNLEEWLKSPVSLLFFKNIRRMRIRDRDIHWDNLGPGPIPNSEWMTLYENENKAYLLIRSDVEMFPEEALYEIRQERMLGVEEEIDFPHCNIEIVLGAKGRLYVVLPTGVKTALPFACNAPFIQDPARLKIKDPETSPTNRWLLKWVGTLAASAMLRWLNQTEMSTAERAMAYSLLPDVDRDDRSLEGVCSTTVEEAFGDEFEGHPLLLTEDGDLTPEMQCIAIPKPLFDIWPAEQVSVILDEEKRPALCRYIEPADCEKLVHWNVLVKFDKKNLLETLETKHLPRPGTWRQLLNLWVYIAPEFLGYQHFVNEEHIRIVPVQGKNVLYASGEIVRLGEKKLLQSEKDWEFLAEHLIVMNQNWSRFLAEQRRTASEHNDKSATEAVEAAYAVLEEIGLEDTSNVNKVIDQFATKYFSQKSTNLQGCVQLAQIAAKLGATIGEGFKYATSDRKFRSVKKGILFDADGSLRELLPEQMHGFKVLHSDYTADFHSCSRENWLQWVSSGRSGLHTFVPFVETLSYPGYRSDLDEELKKRNFVGIVEAQYKNPWFKIQDWDFDSACWKHWQILESRNSAIWTSITKRILSEKENYWSSVASAQIIEVATNGNERTITRRGVTSSWVLKLRNLRCLPDTREFLRKPDELLRRTPETESLIDVEPFVHRLLDTEATRALLDLLGVRSTPTGPDRLLDCLRALSKAESPPAHEVEKWYIRLDQMVDSCSTENFEKIKQAFQSEKLILTQNGICEATSAVFLASSEVDVPDAELIRKSVNYLTLWRKIGVADRPTVELAIDWLRNLPANKALEPDDARRVRSLLTRYPIRIWEECGCWLNLVGEWVSVDTLSYSLTKQSLVPWGHLHQWVKQNTADFQRLPAEIADNPPFSLFPTLATCVENRFHGNPHPVDGVDLKDWLMVVGHELGRINLEMEDETQRVRRLANNLVRTRWCETPGLEIIPYINGTPAGTPRQTDVLWLGQMLYVERMRNAKLARRVPEEIGKAFGHSDIKSALDYSFDRTASAIRDYLEENFELLPASAITEESSDEIEQYSTEEKNEVETTAGAETDQDSSEPDSSNIEDTLNPEENETRDTVIPSTYSEENNKNVIGTKQPRQPAKPTNSEIIERYCNSQGFSKDSDNRFFHEDGSCITRTNGTQFPWEHRTRIGHLVRYYWPKDHCLEREPLQLEADVWGLIEKHPETYSLVLVNTNGCPVEVTGSHLCAMREEGKVILHPATYRLVYHHDRYT